MIVDIGSRVRWLLDVAAVTSGEAGRVLAARLGGDERSGMEAVERLRTGTAAATTSEEQLAVIADYCDVPPAYFGNDPVTVHAIREHVFARVLREDGVWPYVVCRVAVPSYERWEQLRAALRLLRSLPREESPWSPAAGGEFGETWHDASRQTMDDLGTAAMTARSEEQLDALCARVVEDCALLPPFTPQDLCGRLGELRGRRITITATDLGATTGVGHLAPTRRGDLILVEKNAPEHQQELVIYHEVVHLLCDHLAVGDGITCGIAGERGEPTTPADWCEWEAEVGARTLARFARQPRRPNRLSRAGAEDSPDHSIAAAFGFT